MIRSLEVEIVPYWVNLEIGLLIRLWDLAESSFNHLRKQSYLAPVAVPLDQPRAPEVGQQLASCNPSTMNL